MFFSTASRAACQAEEFTFVSAETRLRISSVDGEKVGRSKGEARDVVVVFLGAVEGAGAAGACDGSATDDECVSGSAWPAVAPCAEPNAGVGVVEVEAVEVRVDVVVEVRTGLGAISGADMVPGIGLD